MVTGTQCFSFTSIPEDEFGIVTIATKLVDVAGGKETIRVGFSFTEPKSDFDKVTSEKVAEKTMLSSMCVLMAGRSPDEARSDIARSAWCLVGKDMPDAPGWSKDMDLGMNKNPTAFPRL